MPKKTLVISAIILSLLTIVVGSYVLVSENWRHTGRNLKKARSLSLGEKITIGFENSAVKVSDNGVYRMIIFPLPSIMAHPTGHVVLRSNDDTIMRIQISEEILTTKDLQGIEWKNN